jgi:transglutaminase-like putative cysteine protease
MRYRIQHSTYYQYQQPVTLQAHTLRLRPRCDAVQQVVSFELGITPAPLQQTTVVDTDGNHTIRLWFDLAPTDSLKLTTVSEVITCRTNPFDYLAEPWAITLPIDYPTSLFAILQPYLQPSISPAISPQAAMLAAEISHQVEGNVGFFLSRLTQCIYETCRYTSRATGSVWPSAVTWEKKLGSCRDFAVLFMEACRAVGLAARFVSGYEEGDSQVPHRDLHAWAEVYVPGGGWRGFDPTHGLAVADRHVALVASPFPLYAAPVSGSTVGGGQGSSRLDTEVRVALLED